VADVIDFSQGPDLTDIISGLSRFEVLGWEVGNTPLQEQHNYIREEGSYARRRKF